MGNKSRVPMQVAPEFEKKLKDLQVKIMKKQGEKMSLRDLTEKISKTSDFEKMEESIIKNSFVDLKINLDVRRRK